MSLGNKVDPKEAEEAACSAVLYPKLLANKYGLVRPAWLHNMLVSLKLKSRGYCYHWTQDMLTYLNSKGFNSLQMHWGISGRDSYFEHNSVVITSNDGTFEEGILLDPWRNSSILYWNRVKDDKEYTWMEDTERTKRFRGL